MDFGWIYYLEPAHGDMQDHYTAIDYMMKFGIKKMDYMQEICLQSVEDVHYASLASMFL